MMLLYMYIYGSCYAANETKRVCVCTPITRTLIIERAQDATKPTCDRMAVTVRRQCQLHPTSLNGSCRAADRDAITDVFSIYYPPINTGDDVDRITPPAMPCRRE